MCPRCKTSHWDQPRPNAQGLRSDLTRPKNVDPAALAREMAPIVRRMIPHPEGSEMARWWEEQLEEVLARLTKEATKRAKEKADRPRARTRRRS
jgi:hypothetical protein